MKINLPQFDRARVLVVGDVMLDRYWIGDVARISPEAPVPVVEVGRHEDRPGGAANVAMNLARLGARVSLVGLVGHDPTAEELRTRLEAAGIRCALVETVDEPTILKLRVIARNQQLIRLDMERPFTESRSAEIDSATGRMIADADVLVLSDYGKNTLADIQGLIGLARKHGKPVLVDPKGTDFTRYAGVTILKPNLSEFEAVAGRCAGEDDLIAKGRQLVDRLDIGNLLITRGRHGMTLIGADGDVLQFPARAKEVYDVTGAGDTVVAVLAAAIAAGETMADAITLANLAAGIVVGKLGTATVTRSELRRAVSEARGIRPGVTTVDELLEDIAEARANGSRIVFTNGCFDILHAGHVRYLEEARALGDRLIVGVNSDASVRRLKGAERPYNTLDRRMTVLSALQAVDWVVPFDDDTPNRLLEAIRPDVLTKGGDYDIDQVVGAEIVTAYGGEVRVLAHERDLSTTAIIRAIRDREGR